MVSRFVSRAEAKLEETTCQRLAATRADFPTPPYALFAPSGRLLLSADPQERTKLQRKRRSQAFRLKRRLDALGTARHLRRSRCSSVSTTTFGMRLSLGSASVPPAAKVTSALKCSLPLFRVRLARLMGVLPSGLDPLAPRCLWLLLKTFGAAGSLLSPASWPEACQRRGLGTDFLFLAFKLAGLLPHPAEKARARDSISKALGAAGLPTPGPAIVHVTGPTHRQAVTRWLRHEVARVSKTAPLQAMYMRLCSSLVDFNPPSMRTEMFNAPSAFKRFQFRESMLSAEFIFNALRGADMLRVSVSAKRPLPTDASDDARAQVTECRRWLSRWFCAPPSGAPDASLQKLCSNCLCKHASVPLPLRAGSLGSVPTH